MPRRCTSVRSTRQRAVRRALLAALLGAAATSPTRGAEPPAIAAVLLQPRTALGVGGSVALAYKPLVLFEGGRYSADPATALAPAPRLAGRWQRDGSSFVFTPDAGSSFTVQARLQARAAPADGRWQGRFRSLGGVGAPGQGTAVVAVAKTLHFSADGTLRSDSTAGSSTDAPGALATSSRSSAATRYTLAGHVLTLALPDGSTRTQLFYRFPDSDRVIGVGGGTYSAR
ncbi:hypothetical protein ACPOLB_15215 [Rubrivivax sp. RP6-9]|uniref:hypothetical protein n=1 Tax=Rubrivivax sp. RP6-9 TaxID=3415750 RepID=UPI003CC6469F